MQVDSIMTLRGKCLRVGEMVWTLCEEERYGRVVSINTPYGATTVITVEHGEDDQRAYGPDDLV